MVTATANPTDSALAGLPQANVRQAGDFPDDEFVTVRNVPVFAEHTTTGKDGRELKFGPQELQLVANRCNQRIQQSGDYAAICFGHTPSPEETKPMPDLCGYAGPFRLGRMGADNRVAILADFHIYKADLAQFKRHPRRSPELWLEDRYEEMFLDPIALLSSECPRLDMGMMYSARKGGRLVEKYTAVAPAAGNVFVPGAGTSDPSRFAAASSEQSGDAQMAIAQDDIRAIIEAMMKMDVMVELQQHLAEAAGANTSMPGATDVSPPPAPAMASPPGLESAGGEMAMAPPMEPAIAPPMDAPLPEAPMAAEPPMDAGPPAPPAPPAAPEPPAAPDDEEKKPYAANEQGPYQDGTESEIASGEKVEHDIGSPREPSKYAADEAYMDDMEMDDDEFEEYARQRKGRRKAKYEASGTADETSGAALSSTPSVEPDNPGPSGAGSADESGKGEGTGEYQGGDSEEVVKFRKQSDDVLKLRKELDVERGKRVTAERYTRLSSLSEVYALDADDEIKSCAYGRMSDQQFDEHTDRITVRYQRRPMAHVLPTHTPGSSAAAAQAPDRPGNAQAQEKYAKDASDKALTICMKRRAAGDEIPYGEVLAGVKNGTITE